MVLADQIKGSVMSLIIQNDLEEQFNELFNKYKQPEKDKIFKKKIHKINEDKVLLNEEFFAYILLDNTNIKPEVFDSLIKLIYSNITVSRLSIYLEEYHSNFSLLTLSLFNKKLKLNKEQKEYAIKEIKSKETASHVNNGYDSRYALIRNLNWSLEEKVELIPDIYDAITIEQKILEIKNNIRKRIVVDRDIKDLEDLTYVDYYALVKDQDDRDYVFDEVQAHFVFTKYKESLYSKSIEENRRTHKKDNGE